MALTLPGVLLTGTHAGRPAASAVGKGAIYSCTDHSLVYQSDGSTWGTWLDATGVGVADIVDIPTAEMDDTLVLAPDGAGGVEFRAESGGGGGGGANGRIIAEQTYGRVNGGQTTTLPVTPATGDVILLIVGLEGNGRTATATGAGATWTKQASPSDATGSTVQAEIFTGVVGGSPATNASYNTTAGTTCAYAAIIRGPAGTLDASPTTFNSAATTAAGGEKRSAFITPASNSVAIAAGFSRANAYNPMFGAWFNMLPPTFTGDSDCLHFLWNPAPPGSLNIAQRTPTSGTAIALFSIV